MIERTITPGAKIDEMPVLISPQGGGKSAYVQHLLPRWAWRDWHGDALNLHATNKEQAESLKGRVIVEIAEMVGSTRADIERLKAFLTRTNDGQHRGAWARHAESAPRQSIFIGTTNDPKCLPNDPTGNRRFVPITLGPALDAVEPYLEANLLQLWAEAVYKHHRPDDYPDWRTARLPRSLFAQQRALNDEHRAANVIIADALDTLNIDKDLWLITEIADEIDLDLKNRAEQLALGKELRARRWTKDKITIDGKRGTYWSPPKADEVGTPALPF